MSLFEKSKMHLVLFVTRMVVMGFVRATCSRGGSVCKDWFDRAGKMVYWLTRNVLSVDDFMWAKEGMELELPDGSTEIDQLRGEVKLTLEKRKGASDKRSVLDLHGLELGGVRRTRTRSQEWPAELI